VLFQFVEINRHNQQHQGIKQEYRPIVIYRRMLRKESHEEQQGTAQALQCQKNGVKEPEGLF
jgi:hypothetical protein